MKDINNKKDLIIRLVAHDIGQKDSDSSLREDTISDDEEIVLGEVVGDQCLRKVSGGRVHQVVKPVDSHVVSPKTTTSTSSLKKFLALSKCCQPTSGENIESIESTGNQIMEPSKTYVKRAIAELDMPTSKSLAEATSSRDKLQYKVGDMHNSQKLGRQTTSCILPLGCHLITKQKYPKVESLSI